MDSNGMERCWRDEEGEILKNMTDNFWEEEPPPASVSQLHHKTMEEVDSEPVNELQSNRTEDEGKREIDPSRATMTNVASSSKKLKAPKASNFEMSEIVIGDWRRPTMRVGDLTAKVYYAKRKLVWEILDGQLKSKMEILWSDISAIKADMLENRSGILQIELSKPPLFYREIPPQPKKHTTWHQIHDFTGGQALLHRRHAATIPSNFLEKHYKQLIHFDERLFELSQKSFPSQECPYFDIGTSFDASELPVNFNQPIAQQYPTQFNFSGPMAQQYPLQFDFSGTMAQQHSSQLNFNGTMAQQYPSQFHFSGPMAQLNFNGTMTQQYPLQFDFRGPMTQLWPYPLPPANVAVAGNQFVNTPNMNNAGAGSSQLLSQTTWDAETMPFPRANPSVCNAEIMLLPRANPSPQCNNHQVFPGHNYPFNNIEKHGLMQQSQIGLPNIDDQRIGPSFFINPNNSINNYQMSDDANQVTMLRNNGPSVQPDTWLPSAIQMETKDDTSYLSNDEDLCAILRPLNQRL